MRITIIILGMILFGITSVNAQWWRGNEKVKGNGNVITKIRNLSDYDRVIVAGSMKVVFVSGKEGSITVEGESNIIPHIITEVTGETLKIYIEDGYSINTSRNTKLTVPFIELDKVSLSGSGDVYSESEMKATNFSTVLSGSGDMKLNIKASEVSVNITGSGNLTLEGDTENLECRLKGSGNLKAYSLNAKKANAMVTGSGGVKITVTDKLIARVTGSGDVNYQGNPEKEDKKITGSGNITSR